MPPRNIPTVGVPATGTTRATGQQVSPMLASRTDAAPSLGLGLNTTGRPSGRTPRPVRTSGTRGY